MTASAPLSAPLAGSGSRAPCGTRRAAALCARRRRCWRQAHDSRLWESHAHNTQRHTHDGHKGVEMDRLPLPTGLVPGGPGHGGHRPRRRVLSFCFPRVQIGAGQEHLIWTPEAGMAASGLSSLEVAAWAGAVECVISPVGTAAWFRTYYEYHTSILECSLPNQAADVGLQAA